MRKSFILLILIIFVADARAQVVNSCDGSYSAKITGRHEILVDHLGIKIGLTQIDHDISGGAFDSSGKLFVVYGIPNKVDLLTPQAEYLSIYTTKPKPRIVMRRKYGGGIYDVAIGVDSNRIFVSSRFGFDIINLKTMKIKSFAPMSEPFFSRQRCKNK